VEITRAGFEWALRQVCLSYERARRRCGYADEWIVGIQDVTPPAKQVPARVRVGELN
jgi:hypothetical protein